MIACLHLPYFATTLVRAAFPELPDKPLIIAQYKGSRGKVYAACAQAEAVGVRVGDAVSRAWALCPEAQVLLAEPSRIRREIKALLLALSAFSQYLEVDKDSVQAAVFYLDLGKLRPQDGKAIAAKMVEQMQALGFAASVGLAAGKFPALVAAKTGRPRRILLINRGEEKNYLAGFPSGYLPMERETARRLALLGLQRMGQIALLPRAACIAQFGKEGDRLHRLASGEDGRYIPKYQPPRVESAARQFDTPLENRLTIEANLGAVAAELAGGLAKEDQACREATLTLRLENRTEHEVSLRLREQVHGSLALYRVLERLLKRLNIRAGVVEIEVQIGRLGALLPRQLSLFDEPAKVEPRDVLLEMIERYGENYFYTVVPNSYLQELLEGRFRLEKFEVA
jgi:DNA polymerase IV